MSQYHAPISQDSYQDITSNDVGLSLDKESMSQITSSQLADVQPTDWAFQVLQSFVERYGAIAGYSVFQGNRAMTRAEFAVGLNAVLNRVNELLNSATADLVTQEDLAILRKLQEEFAAVTHKERDRIDTLEAHTQQLEADQFSTTTQLNNSAIFAPSDAFGQADVDNNAVLQQRVRFNFDTSFTGKDRLRTRLAFGNFEPFDLPTNEGHLGFDTNTDGCTQL